MRIPLPPPLIFHHYFSPFYALPLFTAAALEGWGKLCGGRRRESAVSLQRRQITHLSPPLSPPAVFKGGDGSGGGIKAPPAAAAASIIQDTRTTSKGAREEESSRVKSIGLPKSG